jgi:hypothetical protein
LAQARENVADHGLGRERLGSTQSVLELTGDDRQPFVEPTQADEVGEIRGQLRQGIVALIASALCLREMLFSVSAQL